MLPECCQPLGLFSQPATQRWLNSLHLGARWHRHRQLRVLGQCLLSLTPWRKSLFVTKGFPLGSVPSHRETITTDSCLSGQDCWGQWSAQDPRDHINVLELGSVHLALWNFLPYLKGKHVLVRSDSTSPVFHISHHHRIFWCGRAPT